MVWPFSSSKNSKESTENENHQTEEKKIPADTTQVGMPEMTDAEKHVARQKALVYAQFGPGSWERSSKLNKPHRCNGHLDDFLYAASSWPFLIRSGPHFIRFFQCQFSSRGNEPERLYVPPEGLPNDE